MVHRPSTPGATVSVGEAVPSGATCSSPSSSPAAGDVSQKRAEAGDAGAELAAELLLI